MNRLTLTTLFLLLATSCLIAQNAYKVGKAVTLKVEGTSTLHDWEMESSSVTGNATFEVEANEIKSLDGLTISIPAESMKSGKDAMDKNAYKALKTSDNKTITFQMSRLIGIEKSASAYVITCEGKLTIAGTSKLIQLKATCQLNGNGSIQCKGEKVFNMTEYKVEPPSFMFGSVKTGEEVKILFDVVLTKA